jgi:Fur family transcriptional regulator, ferric uptake regulator
MQSDKDFRITRQRRIILDEMKQLRRHPTACELYDAVKCRLPRISLATVYRNLEILCDKGMLKKIAAGGRQKRFDINPGAHYHAHCVCCGAIMDIPVDPQIISRLQNKPDELENFQVIEARIEFFGKCGACRLLEHADGDVGSRIPEVGPAGPGRDRS